MAQGKVSKTEKVGKMHSGSKKAPAHKAKKTAVAAALKRKKY